jgi:hypothetical protein
MPPFDVDAFDRKVDSIVQSAFKASPPDVLYHYTKWEGAEGILRSRQFWFTEHNCTNDEAELVAADEIIVDTATTLRGATTRIAADVLEKFRVNYSETKLTKLRRVFIACFSSTRNSDTQWREYADSSKGLCLGIPVLNEAGPSDDGLIRLLTPVDYLESSWRARTRKVFEQISSEVTAAAPRDQATGLRIQRSALNALFRVAAYAAVTAKQPKWSNEQEWRQIIFAPNTVSIEVRQRESLAKRYLALFMRAGEKHILQKFSSGQIMRLGLSKNSPASCVRQATRTTLWLCRKSCMPRVSCRRAGSSARNDR